jgi:hypothetical protein
LVAVDAVIIELLSCNDASTRCVFEGEKPANQKLALQGVNSFASSTVPKQGFNGDAAVVSYLEKTKEITMKLTTIAFVSALALTSTAALVPFHRDCDGLF